MDFSDDIATQHLGEADEHLTLGPAPSPLTAVGGFGGRSQGHDNALDDEAEDQVDMLEAERTASREVSVAVSSTGVGSPSWGQDADFHVGCSTNHDSHVNSHANGHANGQANGYVNGHANGHTNDHVNGSQTSTGSSPSDAPLDRWQRDVQPLDALCSQPSVQMFDDGYEPGEDLVIDDAPQLQQGAVSEQMPSEFQSAAASSSPPPLDPSSDGSISLLDGRLDLTEEDIALLGEGTDVITTAAILRKLVTSRLVSHLHLNTQPGC